MRSDDGAERLSRCIRDLTALTALPSLCVGRSSQECLDILIDALPTALACDLIYFALPGSLPAERGALDRAPLSADCLEQVRLATADSADGASATVFLAGDRLWSIEAEIPVGAQRGRLLAGRRSPLDPETDRVLVRTAANLVGTIAEAANILEVARRKDDFLAMLGHELRNPLAPIMTAVELLHDNPSVARERDVIERHTHHLVRVVDDLLDVSRIARGQIELRREPVPLAQVLQQAVELASPLLTRHRHHLVVDDVPDITIEGDPIRLTQIFGNLLTNAAKFTPTGGRIAVLVANGPTRVEVAVRDNGRGIASDQLARIFEPFVQADRERDVLHGGLGLGLSIVRNLVELHRGSISARSGGQGQGSTFTVVLPTVRPASPQPPVAAPPRISDARARFRVLVVDDSVDIADLLSDVLAAKGFQTATAHDGRSALATWRDFAPHAGVFDVGLPGMSGHDVAREIRATYGETPLLIAVTGYGQPSDRSRAEDAGFDSHLVKPVSVDALVRLLDQKLVGLESKPPAPRSTAGDDST
jgi:signal transduction histidine kinase/ActR/RegA family two-component response regulator